MNADAKRAMIAKLQALLVEAGLPYEHKLIGRKFVFTYEVRPKGGGEGELVRVSGTVHGIELHNDSNGFLLITSPLPRKRLDDTVSPSISFGTRWIIFFPHNNDEGKPDINGHEVFYGELELL